MRPDGGDLVLERIDRQRRRVWVPAVPERHPGRHVELDELLVHRPDLRATSYTLGVAAYDAAGNVSGTATLSQATSSCPDTQPPSTPAGLAASSVTQTSVKLSWNASTDNVGVTGYRLYSNGTQVGTSTSMSYSFTGLACGTSYTLGVAAYDAAGNVSPTATFTQSTSACPDTQAPSTPTGLRQAP